MKFFSITADNALVPIPGNGEFLTNLGTQEAAIEWLLPLASKVYESSKTSGKGAILLSGGQAAYVPSIELYDLLKELHPHLAISVRQSMIHSRAKEFVVVQFQEDNRVAALLIEMDDTLEEIWKSLHVMESVGGARFRTGGVS